MPPAARISDMHTCPMVNPGPVPHVGGPEISGSANVMTGYMPQGRVSDSLVCVPAIDKISKGSPTVIVNNKQAARIGDPTVHGGVIVAGCPTVIIGDSGQGSAFKGASASGAPFCEECEKAKKAREAAEQAKAPPPNEAPLDAVTKPPKSDTITVTAEQAKVLQQKYVDGVVIKQTIDEMAWKVADETGGVVAEADLKSVESAMRKAIDKKKGDVSQVMDFARNTIVVEAGKEQAALEILKKQTDIPEDNIEQTFAAEDPCGYSGINVKVPTPNGIGEVQINSPEMIYAKEKPEVARSILGEEKYNEIASRPDMPEGGKGHTYYEAYRVEKDPAKAKVIADQSKAYYASVRSPGGGG